MAAFFVSSFLSFRGSSFIHPYIHRTMTPAIEAQQRLLPLPFRSSTERPRVEKWSLSFQYRFLLAWLGWHIWFSKENWYGMSFQVFDRGWNRKSHWKFRAFGGFGHSRPPLSQNPRAKSPTAIRCEVKLMETPPRWFLTNKIWFDMENNYQNVVKCGDAVVLTKYGCPLKMNQKNPGCLCTQQQFQTEVERFWHCSKGNIAKTSS